MGFALRHSFSQKSHLGFNFVNFTKTLIRNHNVYAL